jgi:hypothetical protein
MFEFLFLIILLFSCFYVFGGVISCAFSFVSSAVLVIGIVAVESAH